MMEKRERGEFRTNTVAEIAASEVTWSEVDASVAQTEQSAEMNRKYFEVLKRRKYVRNWRGQVVAKQCTEGDKRNKNNLFRGRWDGLVVGEKLAEGGQAEIYEASFKGDKDGVPSWVVKVFKAGSLLQRLENQWPRALLKFHQDFLGPFGFDKLLQGGMLLKDERMLDRFAFLMPRHWGDLRKLIDLHMMLLSHNQGPPFHPNQVLYFMAQLVTRMCTLHAIRPPILHKDLKAENILVYCDVAKGGPYLDDYNGCYKVVVADYECSVGVVGTGLWRAPEILQQLKDKVPMSDLKFTEKSDIYSFGMICYELVTGRIPFEDYEDCFYEARELVLSGHRPELPPDLDPIIRGIITSCWHPIPSQRPSFLKLCWKLMDAVHASRWKIISLKVLTRLLIINHYIFL